MTAWLSALASQDPRGQPVAPALPAGWPRIVGIVNITEDSFSDGGRYLDPAAALAFARQLRADGADIIELGPAAWRARPDRRPRPAAMAATAVRELKETFGVPRLVSASRKPFLRAYREEHQRLRARHTGRRDLRRLAGS